MRVFKHIFIACTVVASAATYASGEDTYKAVCANCHSKAVANSPQMGDVAKWAPLIAEGQVIITAHGYVGVRAMPAKGGKHDLSVEGFSEALNYMVNQSGGQWKKPDSKMMAAIRAEIEARQKLNASK
jgi:cytochrome c5